jgi:hypothetical protein
MGMGMAAARHSDAGAEIEILFAVGRIDAHALAPVEGDLGTGVGWQDGGDHGLRLSDKSKQRLPACRVAPLMWKTYKSMTVKGQMPLRTTMTRGESKQRMDR